MQASKCNQTEEYDIGKQISYFFPSRTSCLNSDFLYQLNEFAPREEYTIFRPKPWDKEIVQKAKEILDLNLNHIAGKTIVFLKRNESDVECGKYNEKLGAARLDVQSKRLYAHEAQLHPYLHYTNKKIADAVTGLDSDTKYSLMPTLRDLEEALATYASGRIFDDVCSPNEVVWKNENQRYIYERLLEMDQTLGPKKTLEKMFLPEVVTVIGWM